MRIAFSASAVLVVLASLVACERERVDVADADGGEPIIEVDAQPGIVPGADSGVDVVLVTCGPPPVIGRCPPCPTGYEQADGEATCGCCP